MTFRLSKLQTILWLKYSKHFCRAQNCKLFSIELIILFAKDKNVIAIFWVLFSLLIRLNNWFSSAMEYRGPDITIRSIRWNVLCWMQLDERCRGGRGDGEVFGRWNYGLDVDVSCVAEPTQFCRSRFRLATVDRFCAQWESLLGWMYRPVFYVSVNSPVNSYKCNHKKKREMYNYNFMKLICQI